MKASGPSRRIFLRDVLALATLPCAAVLNLGCARTGDGRSEGADKPRNERSGADSDKTGSHAAPPTTETQGAMQIQYLEIVTEDVDAVCATYERLYGVTFGDAEAVLGGARTAPLANGGLLGVRGPLGETEEPVVRPYVLVDDIASAVAAAEEEGAMIAHPPLELPGHGTFAIFFLGGNQHGLWQL